MKFIFFGIIALLVLWLLHAVLQSEDHRIKQFVTNQHETVVSIDTQVFNLGPFWYIKGCRVYKVTTNKNVYWIRFGTLFGPDLYEVEVDNKYKQLEAKL